MQGRHPSALNCSRYIHNAGMQVATPMLSPSYAYLGMVDGEGTITASAGLSR